VTFNDLVFKASNDFDIDEMPAIGGDPPERRCGSRSTHTGTHTRATDR
jgi:hypothetical protein